MEIGGMGYGLCLPRNPLPIRRMPTAVSIRGIRARGPAAENKASGEKLSAIRYQKPPPNTKVTRPATMSMILKDSFPNAPVLARTARSITRGTRVNISPMKIRIEGPFVPEMTALEGLRGS